MIGVSRSPLVMMARRRGVGIAGRPPEEVVEGETCCVCMGCSTAPQPFVFVFHVQFISPSYDDDDDDDDDEAKFNAVDRRDRLSRPPDGNEHWDSPRTAGKLQTFVINHQQGSSEPTPTRLRGKTRGLGGGAVTDQIQQRMTVRRIPN